MGNLTHLLLYEERLGFYSQPVSYTHLDVYKRQRFYRAERMTDFSDGGGRMSPNEIVSGVENSVFSDVSDVDRAAGDVSIRKTYAAVTSADTAEYLDAGVVVFKAPADPAASVLAMSTGNFYDERDAIKNRLEQTITRGARWSGYLWGCLLYTSSCV